MKTNIQLIYAFLSENLSEYSPIKQWDILAITEQTSLTSDPDNELLYIAHLKPTNETDYYTEHEPAINTHGLTDLFRSQTESFNHLVTIEQYIGLNATILLPITFLS